MHIDLQIDRYFMLRKNSFRNVLQDEAGRLKVTDFGLSKIAQEKDVYGYKMTGGTGSCIKICPFIIYHDNAILEKIGL